jgi:dTDP-4-amino-4,6-dideoxygalactose transaminase
MESTAWLPICPTLNEEEIDNIIKITNQVYLELTGGLI